MGGGLVAVVVRANVEKRAFKVEISSAGVDNGSSSSASRLFAHQFTWGTEGDKNVFGVVWLAAGTEDAAALRIAVSESRFLISPWVSLDRLQHSTGGLEILSFTTPTLYLNDISLCVPQPREHSFTIKIIS